MFRQIYDLARSVLFLTEDLQRTKTEVKELREELRDLGEIVRELKFEVRQNRGDAEHAHERLILQLENIFDSSGGFPLDLPRWGADRDPLSATRRVLGHQASAVSPRSGPAARR